ncbi:MAG: phospholipid/cholesterol/gamma-HCH transport system substrate-binding protein, partial [Thermoleophilaceae bacterium]|nr:phospholipid/cholesterol/gamma-HCH transport system substrate-binding protein [Thermoleophilaceae bacterium]
SVTLRNGVAVVHLKIRKKYAPIYKDATMLLRPKTGLKDMVVEMDPGTPGAGKLKEGGTIPITHTAPDVNLDEVLAQLDGDTRSYLTILITAGGQAFSQPGYPSDLRQTLKRFEPTARFVRSITGTLSQRRANLRRVIHNFQLLTNELGKKDTQLAQLVDSSNANFKALAHQDQNIQATLRELPPTLQTADTVLGKATGLATQLGQTSQALRPAARALGPALRETRPFLRTTTPIIHNQLRPFARDARPAVRELRNTARQLKPVTPRLTRTFGVLNQLLNALAYNPPGSEEGYLFWASWVNHAGASIFSTQDAHGPVRRGLVLASCSSLGLLERVTQNNPPLALLYQLLHAPPSQQVCPSAVPPSGSARQDGTAAGAGTTTPAKPPRAKGTGTAAAGPAGGKPALGGGTP